MMNPTSFETFAWGFHLHILSGTLLFIGAVLFVTWMIRFAKKDQLKNWIIGLVVFGLLSWLLSATSGFYGWGHHQKGICGPYDGTQMMDGWNNCIQDEGSHEQMEKAMDEMMGTETPEQ